MRLGPIKGKNSTELDEESILEGGDFAKFKLFSLIRLKRKIKGPSEDRQFFYRKKIAENRGHLEIGIDSTKLIENDEKEKSISPAIDNSDHMIPNNLPGCTINNGKFEKSSFSKWRVYCHLVTLWAPPFILRKCGMKNPNRQMAWREKIALISVILGMSAITAFLTFGFSRTICHDQEVRLRQTDLDSNFMIIHGKVYSNEMWEDAELALNRYGYYNSNLGPLDASFLFQNVNGNCMGIIKPRPDSSIPHDVNGNLAWYFPCLLRTQDNILSSGPSNNYDNLENCHLDHRERNRFYDQKSMGKVFYTWNDIRNSERELVVYLGNVWDLGLLDFLDEQQMAYPSFFKEMGGLNLKGYDLSVIFSDGKERKLMSCMNDIIKVGEIDSKTIGCLSSDVMLVISLIVIISVVMTKFIFACYFRWRIASKQGVGLCNNREMSQYLKQIDNWSSIARYCKQRKMSKFWALLGYVFKTGNYSKSKLRYEEEKEHTIGTYLNNEIKNSGSRPKYSGNRSINDVAIQSTSRSTYEMKYNYPISKYRSTPFSKSTYSSRSFINERTFNPKLVHANVVDQTGLAYWPNSLPLIHTICFVTCYSEDEVGLRTTLDSICASNYPNSHKLVMLVCDGIIRGSGNELTTPDIALSMMEDFVIDKELVTAASYLAVASGFKRHNMAKVYAGFYKFDSATIPSAKHQKVPMITIVKCGTPKEQNTAKPGNRGKRDSQVILMSFLEKVIFDERMTELDYQILKAIWCITGMMADIFQTVLMVDADTKIYPDSLTHMNAEMAKDSSIMGLCGETKVENKKQSWVTAIQVFEYYISHHMSKAFESVFGSVTCLPGCFSLYRIKAPKGPDGYWVPLLANPDIVERYSNNVTNTLHMKNLLLLGEDRYLSSLMLRTFPKRKQIFMPKAACKTIVPNKFSVLLSQRRRWINSTIHNLLDLLLVRDLCGTFCFSMQCVIIIELIGITVLPLAIFCSIYVIIFSTTSGPTPVLTLLLLALILGLPALIVIVTLTSWSYLIWMAIYIISLPIWNFILPCYAYWKFDDFSWGDTRTISNCIDEQNSAEDTKEGFDSTQVKMQYWHEFEKVDFSN